MTELRHRVDPMAVPPVKAARRIGLTLAQFEERLPKLLAAGFPPANAAGTFCLPLIDRWLGIEPDHPQAHDQSPLTPSQDAKSVLRDRVARMNRRWAT